jgi:tetraacyldisaccharide 4'-kinase
LQKHPQTDVILLDDGFQHRSLARDFDLVLIDATNPFGFEHVLPRGLLREPLGGLKRASAFLITRVDQAAAGRIDEIVSELKGRNAPAPIFQCRHVVDAVVTQDGQRLPVSELRGRKLFAFCGIGNPRSFFRQLEDAGATIIGSKVFADHHHYELTDLAALANGAEALVTTEKDWVKIEAFASKIAVPVWRATVSIEFAPDDDRRLLEQIRLAMAASSLSAQSAG